MRFSRAEYLQLLARSQRRHPPGFHQTAEPGDSPPLESKLHEQIIEECHRRLWGYIHSRMDRKTTQNKGVCDFVILAEGGHTYYVECKRKGGKLSEDQLIFRAVAARNGHPVHVIETFEEFKQIASPQPS